MLNGLLDSFLLCQGVCTHHAPCLIHTMLLVATLFNALWQCSPWCCSLIAQQHHAVNQGVLHYNFMIDITGAVPCAVISKSHPIFAFFPHFEMSNLGWAAGWITGLSGACRADQLLQCTAVGQAGGVRGLQGRPEAVEPGGGPANGCKAGCSPTRLLCPGLPWAPCGQPQSVL